jgi:hypothetical protein
MRSPRAPCDSMGDTGSAARCAQPGSCGCAVSSGPCMASYTSARSRAERAKGPRWSRLETKGKLPVRGNRPKVGFSPNTPHSEAGTRIEPLVSEPSVSGTCPAATAAPEPPDEPPAMRVRSCGLRVGPSWLFSVVKP